MKNSNMLYWCRKCERHTYWRGSDCQLCKVTRTANRRSVLLALACIAIFVACILRLWWGR